MLAVIETGGKQYSVSEGTIIDVEKLDVEKGKTHVFDKVLLTGKADNLQIGKPYIKGAQVSAKILNHIQDDKVIVFKFKNKTGYKKKQGHRQQYTTVKIESITVG